MPDELSSRTSLSTLVEQACLAWALICVLNQKMEVGFFKIWKERSENIYEIDISYLEEYMYGKLF